MHLKYFKERPVFSYNLISSVFSEYHLLRTVHPFFLQVDLRSGNIVIYWCVMAYCGIAIIVSIRIIDGEYKKQLILL